MRVTSSTYTSLLISSAQNSQQELAQLQQEISTGNSIQVASDNPLAYEQASQTQSALAQLNAYGSAANEATTLASQNNSAMTSLHQIIAQATEYATSVSGNMAKSAVQNIGAEMQGLLSQFTSVVNRQSANGTYLFGGTSNQPPINAGTGTYNSSTNGATTSIEVQPGNSVQTGIVAGRSGSGAVDGFLTDSATGVDVLGSLNQAIADLNAGNASAVTNTDLPALNKALDHISLYVGSTASSMSAVQNASQALQQQIASQDNQLNSLTQSNLASVTVQLQQVQTQYQAALEAGTRILGLSMLNYIGSVPNS